MIKDDLCKLQITIPKKLKKELDIVVGIKRQESNATKSIVIQEALKLYINQILGGK